MANVVIMPRQGQSVESCIITTWQKHPGDKVEVGDILFSYETDKSAFDEPAQVAGTMLADLANEGDVVPCLDPVCVIGAEGEDISALLKKPMMPRQLLRKKQRQRRSSLSLKQKLPFPNLPIACSFRRAPVISH